MAITHPLIKMTTRSIRRYLVGPQQRWMFERPDHSWSPPHIEHTPLYLHVPFCRHFCPYCPYTKIPYSESLEDDYIKTALAEVDWWADRTNAKGTSLYIGGGTPTLALRSVASIVKRIRERFHLTGDVCIETNPADVSSEVVRQLHDMGVELISLGVESFQPKNLTTIGRDYTPIIAEKALELLVDGSFASVNVDLMFALPHQETSDVIADMMHASQLGANQLTMYPLFTFPYTSVGRYMNSSMVHMPNIRVRHTQYQAISNWCSEHDFKRVSVWGFKRGEAPRYSSVTRDSYIGIGPGAGSLLSNGFALNTFDFDSWVKAVLKGDMPVALYMNFASNMAGWWWLYWRFYDTCIPLAELDTVLHNDASKARQWLRVIENSGFATRNGDKLILTNSGAFWLHLIQNYFALNYVNTIWTQARQKSWPLKIAI